MGIFPGLFPLGNGGPSTSLCSRGPHLGLACFYLSLYVVVHVLDCVEIVKKQYNVMILQHNIIVHGMGLIIMDRDSTMARSVN